MPDPTGPMTVNVTVTVTGGPYDFSASNPPVIDTVYSGTTTPAAVGGKSVIQRDGDINLTALDKNDGFTDETNIVFTLAGSVTDTNGQTHSPSWPRTFNQAVAVAANGGTPFQGEGVPEGWAATNASNGGVQVTDPDTDGQNYNYGLWVMLDGVSCPLDPSILNRTRG